MTGTFATRGGLEALGTVPNAGQGHQDRGLSFGEVGEHRHHGNLQRHHERATCTLIGRAQASDPSHGAIRGCLLRLEASKLQRCGRSPVNSLLPQFPRRRGGNDILLLQASGNLAALDYSLSNVLLGNPRRICGCVPPPVTM